MQHTVLVVEDEEDLRDMMREALEMSGYAVTAVEEGQQALDALARLEHVCVVLLDLMMPGMNGIEVFAALRADSLIRHLPVMIVTSRIVSDGELQALAGVQAVLPKSAGGSTLVEAVLHHFSRSTQT